MADLKKSTNTFEAVGVFKESKKTKRNIESSDRWKYSNMCFILECGESSLITYVLGGYNPSDTPNLEYNFSSTGKIKGYKEEGGRKKIDFQNNLSIAWEDRNDKKILEQVSTLDKIKVEIIKGQRVEFLTNYDLIEYLCENLKTDTELKVYGNINYEYYNGNLKENFIITQIYATEISDKNPTKLQVEQTVLFNKDSVGGLQEDGLIPVTAYTPQYIYKNGDDFVNSIIAVPFEFFVDTNTFKKSQMLIDKFFQAEDKKLTELRIIYTHFQTGNTKELTLDDIINDDNRDAIELDLAFHSEEEVLELYIGANRRAIVDGDVKTLKIFSNIARSVSKDGDKVTVKHLHKPNEYKIGQIYFIEDFEGKRKEQQTQSPRKSTPSKAVVNNTEDVGDFDDLFAGITEE